jgi:hypothetical protein
MKNRNTAYIGCNVEPAYKNNGEFIKKFKSEHGTTKSLGNKPI